MEEVLLFGGAFNPVSKAHLQASYLAMNSLGMKHVIFMPSKSKYILENEKKNFSFSGEDRLAMLKKLKEKNEWMIVSDYELKSEEQPRTYFTLKYLLQKGYKAKLLFGSDWLLNLKTKWKYVDEIGEEFSFVVMRRNGDNLDEIFDSDPYLKERKKYFTFIESDDELQYISSSSIRELLKNNKLEEAKKYLPDVIYEYLSKEKLNYGEHMD